MKRFLTKIAILSVGLFLGGLIFVSASPSAHAASNERMMDDAVFDNSGSMSAGDIQNFLNQFPNSCLKNFSDEYPVDYFNYNGPANTSSGPASAATIIRRAADLWGINPRVILGKLEQEENLVTGNSGCNLYQYVSAVGFNCPGSIRDAVFRGVPLRTCVQSDGAMGFARQVTKGAWTLKFAKERSIDNLGWMVPDDASTYYYGPFVSAGNHKRCGSCATIYHDGYFNGVDVQTGATASFYNYTPFLNQAFDEIYEGWFGSTYAAPWRWEFVTQSWSRDLGSLPRGEKATITLKAKNIGANTWYTSGNNPVHLITTYPNAHASGFATSNWPDTSRPTAAQEQAVAPNQIGTFTFEIQAMPQVGTYNEHFSLVAENSGWFNDIGYYLGINVTNPNITGSITQNTYPTTMTAGSTATATVKIQNNSNIAWKNSGPFVTDLYVSPYTRQSAFHDSSWPSQQVVAHMAESTVAPGQTATFTYQLKAPQYNGNYNEQYQLGITNLGWSNIYPSQPISVTSGQQLTKIPIYRLSNPRSGSHFYTSSIDGKNAALALGFRDEGIEFYGSAAPTSTPVYRLYNPGRDVHFFTATTAGRDAAVAAGFRYEGIEFYASDSQTSVPVYRLYQPTNSDHFYTSSTAGKNAAVSVGYIYESIEFYGMP
jgi:hypothetical protein